MRRSGIGDLEGPVRFKKLNKTLESERYEFQRKKKIKLVYRQNIQTKDTRWIEDG